MKLVYTALPMLALLAACGGGGGGPQTVSGGAVGGLNGGVPTTPGGQAHSFVEPTLTKTYGAISAVQSLGYDLHDDIRYDKIDDPNSTSTPRARIVNPDSGVLLTERQGATLYSANVASVRSPGIQVTYDPRNAEFTLEIKQDRIDRTIRMQDPAHRTDFGGSAGPQDGVPNLERPDATSWRDKGVQYLEVFLGDANNDDFATFFYERPGTTTKYVTYAGYVRNRYESPAEVTIAESDDALVTRATAKLQLDRGAMVFGELTPINAVPTTGTARYSGTMIGSMLFNPTLDDAVRHGSYFQWISGTATLNVDFAANTVQAQLAGRVLEPHLPRGPVVDGVTVPVDFPFGTVVLPTNSTFSAAASGGIDLVGSGGFTGSFSAASFQTPGATAPTHVVDIVGSSLEGAFYGPAAQETGAAFRIVGGVPDQRVDIIGSFTGAKP